MEPLLRARGNGDLEAYLALTTAKYPIGRLGTPEEIAAAALFLACGDSSFLTGPVITRTADDGSVIPWWYAQVAPRCAPRHTGPLAG